MINQCNFIGRLGRDPEIRYTQSGKAVASFSIACSEKRGGEEARADHVGPHFPAAGELPAPCE